jgi:hypothetical protein
MYGFQAMLTIARLDFITFIPRDTRPGHPRPVLKSVIRHLTLVDF